MSDQPVTIELNPASDYRRKTYGVVLESTTQHTVTGPQVHNPHHPHRLDVWLNRDGVDPMGKPTTATHSYLLHAQAVTISNTPDPHPTPEGPALRIGQVVRLSVHGYVLGEFLIRAGILSDPALIPVDPGPDPR